MASVCVTRGIGCRPRKLVSICSADPLYIVLILYPAMVFPVDYFSAVAEQSLSSAGQLPHNSVPKSSSSQKACLAELAMEPSTADG